MVRTANSTRGKHTISLAEDNVASTSVSYDRMERRWRLPDTLLGGTVAMREAGQEYLPREPREKQATWSNRLNRSILFNGYEDTLGKIAAKPFQEPVTIQNEDQLDQRLRGMSKNVDLQGNDISQFAADVFYSAMHRGVCHVLVSFPTVREELSLQEELDRGIRPYFTMVDPIDLPAWRSTVMRSGERVLTHIRVKEIDLAAEGDFGEKLVERIKVITAPEANDETVLEDFMEGRIDKDAFVSRGGRLGRVRVFERETTDDQALPENNRTNRSTNFENEEFVENREAGGDHTFPGIPLKSLYFNRTGFMTAEPVLEDLAWLNLAHWQSYSDQRNILRFARVGILFMSGLSKQEAEKEMAIGPTQLWRSTNENAKLQHVEHNGKSIEAGFKDLAELERRMVILGMQPFIEKTGSVTATSRAIDTAKEQSAIKSWVRACAMVMEQCYEAASVWIGEEHPEDFGVEVFNDFGIGLKSGDDLEKLLKMRNPVAPEISHETLIAESKRRGLLADSVDAQDEREKIAEEIGDMMSRLPSPDEEEDEEEEEVVTEPGEEEEDEDETQEEDDQ